MTNPKQPLYYLVVAKTWVHAYPTLKHLLADQTITFHHCGGLEFFDSGGCRYAPMIDQDWKITNLERTSDRANRALVTRRVRNALQEVRRGFIQNPAEAIGKLNLGNSRTDPPITARLVSERSKPSEMVFEAIVNGAQETFTVNNDTFVLLDEGSTLEDVVRNNLALLNGKAHDDGEHHDDGEPHQPGGDHTEGTSWAHRLCHAVGAC